jgi:hypothetical protein
VSTAAEWIRDFLTFRIHVTPAVLLITYYIGAVLIPLLVYDLSRRFHQRLVQKEWGVADGYRAGVLARRGRVVLYAATALVLSELAWRMMFEFFLAYFQMHEALTGMSGA